MPKTSASRKTTTKTSPKTATAKKATAARKGTAKSAAAAKSPRKRTERAPVAATANPPPPLPAIISAPEGAPKALTLCLRALDEKKAEEVNVFDVRDRSSIAEFFVIATATSEPHLRALRVAIEKEFAAADEKIHGREAGVGTGWTVVDAFDVIIHLFLPARRAACQLENLWNASPRRSA